MNLSKFILGLGWHAECVRLYAKGGGKPLNLCKNN